jgi:hypothetical protein
LLRDAWTVAIETLSWIEMRRLNERSALMKTVKQLGVKDPSAIRFAYGLVVETERRKNLIDKLINEVVAPKIVSEYDMGIQAFLRLYVYQTRVVKNWEKINLKEAENIASMGRAILGWETMREIEPFIGFLLTKKLSSIIEGINGKNQSSNFPSHLVRRILFKAVWTRRSNRILKRQHDTTAGLYPNQHLDSTRGSNSTKA